MRIRRRLKWAGVAVCGLILLLWAITFFWELVYFGTERIFLVGPGFFCLYPIPQDFRDLHGWAIMSGESSRTWWPIPWVRTAECDIPFSFLLLVTAIPTAILYRHDRRRPPPGHCQDCGYNLKGNESGICPECGTPARLP